MTQQSTALVRTIESTEPRLPAMVAPMTFEQVVNMGDQLVRTGFLPEHIKTGAQAAAIILTGQELGMLPMRAIRSLQLVKGKVVESADSQLARFKKDGGHAVFRRLDTEAAVLFLRHPNGDEHEESFTTEDARAAGLLGKEMYSKFRRAMLRSRAITAGLKSIGWEGGVGNYDPEEALAFAGSDANGVSLDPVDQADDSRANDAPAERTLAWASAYPFPFQRASENYGKPLGGLGSTHLKSIVKWIDQRRVEKGPAWNDEAYAAMQLVLDARRTGIAKEPTKKAPPAEDGLGNDDVSLDGQFALMLASDKLAVDEKVEYERLYKMTQTDQERRNLLGEMRDILSAPV